MTNEEKKTLMAELLRYYKRGKEGMALLPEGFNDFIKANCPDFFKKNK